MKIVAGRESLSPQSSKELLSAVERLMNEKRKFRVGIDDRNVLHLSVYEADGVRLELHRGEKWEGWLSPRIPTQRAIVYFAKYFETGCLPDSGELSTESWAEIAGFNPLLFIIGGCALIAGVTWYHYGR